MHAKAWFRTIKEAMTMIVRVARCLVWGFILVFAIAALVPRAHATTRIYTTGASDGQISNEREYGLWGFGWSEDRTYTDYTSLVAQSCQSYSQDGTYSARVSQPVFLFPISLLDGRALPPASVRLWLYCTGSMSVYAAVYDSDPGGVVDHNTLNNIDYTRVGTIDCIDGWNSIDVTSSLQQKISSGNSWIGFTLSAPYNDSLIRIAASEDPQGRGAYLEIVPEPSGILALVVGLTGIGGMALRRRR